MFKTLTRKVVPAIVVLLAGATGVLAQTPMYQWINAAPYVTADQDSVYFCEDGTFIGNFFGFTRPAYFRQAEGFFGPGSPGTKQIAASLTNDCQNVVAEVSVDVQSDRNYQFILVGTPQDVENPDGVDTGLDFVVNDHAVVQGAPGTVDVTLVHASPDAPDVTGFTPTTGTFLPLGPFKAFQPAACEGGATQCSLPFPSILGEVIVEIHATAALEAGDTTAVTSVVVDLPALDGQSVTAVATGFLDPGAIGKVQDQHSFKVIGVLTDGNAEKQATVVILEPPAVDLLIEFAVDMNVEILTGNFDPDSHVVTVGGSFNGWANSADTLIPDFINPTIYSKLVEYDDVQIGEAASKADNFSIFYKYVSGATVGDDGNPSGWEGAVGDGQDNRELVVTGNEEIDPETGRLIVRQAEIPTFNNASPEDFFANDMVITFEVDMRPAYYFLADTGFLPIDVQTSEATTFDSGVWANGPLSKAPGGWATWGPGNLDQIDELLLYDDGQTGGDVTAGDSVFSFQVSYAASEPRSGKIKFGTDGWDNENLSQADHVLNLPDEASGAATVALIFGAMETGDGGFNDDLYDPYICTNVDSPTVVRSGGDEGCDESGTAVEAVGGEIPSAISLGDNYPNPFNPSTSFEYAITAPGHVKVLIYDVSGRLVDTLVDEVQSASNYRVTFDASGLSSGIYIYQLRSADTVINKKMLLLK
jgi:hypothetical protein